MKKIISKLGLIIISISILTLFVSINISYAQSCSDLNFTLEGCSGDDANCNPLEDSIVVITESRLGNDSDLTINCARKTECTFEAPDEAEGETSNKVQTCSSEYVEDSECTSSEDGDTIVRCDFIQAYIAGSGTSLLYGYIGKIYQYVAGIGGLIAVFTIVLGGVMIAAAGGDSERVSKAKSMITRSITGLIVLLLSALILYTINPNFFVI
ncbi:hypothetical protein GF376_02070 [Candidatus Peregrinibacteria bacterium]|nr:hypothetical protein [Candidatus Peregrinibacteria bacterium]